MSLATDPEESNSPGPGFLPLFSLMKLEKMAGGNPDFVKRMISVFITEMPISATEIRAAYTVGDYQTIGKVAHRIKPAISNLDIYSLKDIVLKLERLLDHEPGTEDINAMITQIENDIAEVKEMMIGILNR